MASFITGSIAGEFGKIAGDKEEGEGAAEEEDPEIAEARREQEEERKAKHAKFEAEREQVRQGIRDKYGLKKKVEEEVDPDAGRIGRKKKTPMELQAQQAAAMDDDDDEEEGIVDKMLGYFTPITDKLSNLWK
ncbi:complexin-like isoform X2 [Ptychodera flava]|uniref:complexin-like isoform X2 n=1 Tax=Ptychodera flava TaxID=63121 RepID=UPI00396A7477